MRREEKIFYVFFVLIAVITLGFEPFIFSSSEIVCGQITKEIPSRRRAMNQEWETCYTYTYKGEKIQGRLPSTSLKRMSMSKLINLQCIKIEISNFLPSYSRVVDKRILD